ncbi:MAG TPA: M28 family metallopeptidase [Caulobacteraceae bacterium]
MRVLALAVAASLMAGGLASAETAPEFQPSPDRIRAHMAFLASDLLEGREAGTRGYDIAANYVAAEFAKLGLKPAGDAGSYLQRVPLTAYRPAGEGGVTLRARSGRTTPLVFGQDYVPAAAPLGSETRVSAPLVFVGYGVAAPAFGRDDYKGLDVRGKIVVMLAGAPKAIPGEERAHYGGRGKRLEAARRGAVGVITVWTPTRERVVPFERTRSTWRSWSMTWRGADGQAYFPGPGSPALANVSLQGAEKLFAGAKVPWAKIVAAAEKKAGDPPRFDLPVTAEVALTTELKPMESANVAGLMPGSDPAVQDQVIVLSAHLDHLGITNPVNGDAINNGAMDNASGIATMLEAARGFAEGGRPPRRPLLFLAVTAEEKGLVGSEYFAHNPTLPKASLAGDVNLDMPILSYDFRDVTAFGGDRSSMGPAVRRAAQRLGLQVTPDATPEEGIFTRSDHYRFVEQGIPAVFLKTGDLNGGAQATAAFRRDRYHRPSDDLSQPIDYAAGARFARVNYEIAREIADAHERPTWNPGDFFGTLFNGPVGTTEGDGARRSPRP